MRLVLAGLTFFLATTPVPTRQVPTQPFQPALIWEKNVAPGLVYRMEYDPNLPRTLHALRLSPQCPSLHFATELAGKTVNEEGGTKGRWTPTEIARQANAIAAVNGDFFSYDHGAPIGEMVRTGELITTPTRPRAAFAWGPKDATVTTANARAFVTPGEGTEVRLDGINQPMGPNGISLFTPAEGQVQPPKANLAIVLTASEGSFSPNGSAVLSVESVNTDLPATRVPAGHAILVATGNHAAAIAGLRAGDTVKLRTSTEGVDWEKYDNLVGGGPFLLRAGELAVDANAEGFNADFQLRHPRSAIGKTADGDVWIVTVDGRQTCSVGATLEELARVMKRLGCTDAINMDGGGSTALNLLGLTVSRPADGVERPVANGVVVFGPRPADLNGSMRIRVMAHPLGEGLFQAAVYRNGTTVPNGEVIWSARGAAWIDEGGGLHVVHRGPVKIGARALGQTVEATIIVPGPTVDPKKLAPADR